MELEKLKYPIGKFEYGKQYSREDFVRNIQRIDSLAGALKSVVSKMKPAHWQQSYRAGGWNARQVVYHIGDSHLNGYHRLMLALTEDKPTARIFEHEKWAELTPKTFDLENSMLTVQTMNKRIADTLKILDETQIQRMYFHPGLKRDIPIIELAAIYAWHGEHHLGHLKIIAES